MRALTASQLLTLWENGLTQPPWQRAIALLAAALPDASADTLADLSLGQRDAQLLALREILFGPRFTSLSTCPVCHEQLELNFEANDLQIDDPAQLIAEQGRNSSGTLSLSTGNYHATFRLPNSHDLNEITELHDASDTRLSLLERCLISADENGEEISAAELPDSVSAAIVDRMAAADPQGSVQIALICPACAHHWEVDFDILSFLWAEVNAWAQHILREIHLLAAAYGWREADILGLSPWRRQAYLQMVIGSI